MSEQTYMIFRPTRLAFIKWYALGLFMIILGIIAFLYIPEGLNLYSLLLFLPLGAVFALVAEILRRTELYAITSNRIVEKSGIVNTNEDSIYWDKMSNYSMKQGFFERMLNIGTVELWAIGGEEAPEIILRKVPNVKKVVAVLDKLIQKR
jgi:hypothetical protein